MNYLAHAYLSFNNPEILVGNMISDFVKGKAKFNYLPGVQRGITLHRLIDEFTDDHPVTKNAKIFFRPAYRLYSGAFIDVVYDHFLATDHSEFLLPTDLEQFSKNVYQTLWDNFSHLPPNFQKMLPYMQSQNWLCNYQYKWGVEKGFYGLVTRATYLQDHSTAFVIFNTFFDELKAFYGQFFPDLKQFASESLSNLLRGGSIYI